MSDSEPSIWLSRGYLPHFDDHRTVQHVTFRLGDSLPVTVLRDLDAVLETVPPERRCVERWRRLEAWVDAGHGSCILRRPEAAQEVEAALLHFDGRRYQLLAWAVMPNHVHVLVQTVKGHSLTKIVASWKSYSARRISRFIGSSCGTSERRRVWQREYWDRYIRDQGHLRDAVDYIHWNPVVARLVTRPEDWRWSSAWRGRATHDTRA